MTPEERSLLTQFLSDLGKTSGVAKDAEAAQMIDTAFRSNPDAAYVLTQHALLADQALHQAQQQIDQLQDELQRLQPAPQPSSFLGGGGLGPRVAQPQSQWAQAAQQPPPQQGGFFGGGPLSGQQSGLGGFLRNAGTTAAGVAGGAFLFEGLSNLFGGGRGFGGGGFGGGGWGGGGGFGQENVTINNYGDGGGFDDGGGYDSDPGTAGDIGGDDYT